MTCGIYQILNKATKYRYVGLSRHIEERWGEHWNQLNRGYHPHPELQRVWTSDGADIFEWRILEELSILATNKEMHARERFWIHKFKDKLYNDSRAIINRPGHRQQNSADGAAWPFPCPAFTQRRTHMGPPLGMDERRKVMYSGRRDHIRLAEIAAAKRKQGAK